MPGNKQLYNEQMNAGHEAAWNHDWADAANAYGRALQEFPDDAEAHLSLGFSLLRAERLNEALRVYGRAHQLVPDDPIPLEKSADVLQRMGRLEESAKQYANVADAYLKQRDLDKAISSWEKATELSPGYVTLHAKLAKAYVRIGDRRRAVYHYLMLAFHFSRSGDWTQATRAAQQALKLNKKNVEALNALRAAESASQVSLPTPVKPDEATEAAPVEDIDLLEFGDLNDDSGPRVVEVDPLGPMGGAMSVALSSLADHIMMSGGFEAGGVEALQAMEFHRQGLYS
ncbi:MAG: tetratricopeptide repeat protein [Chloroflexota bacterium]